MMHRLAIFICLFVTSLTIDRSSAAGPPEPAREFRAAWIAVVHNYDWPSSAGQSAGSQKAQLIAQLDKAAALNLNAVIFQVRPQSDAVYASRLEPWSPYLSGSMGSGPGYDPLAFVIQEAHRRGLELHAWFNPFRASAGKYNASGSHVTRTHPEWIRNVSGGQRWIDPGEPAAQAWVLGVMRDVLRRYDIDGLHIDDYFYPYPVRDRAGRRTDGPFPDEATYARYGRGRDRGDWRRANIDGFVRSMYGMVKGDKPWVKVGISPFGIWRPGVPRGVEAQLDAYAEIFADSRRWLREGWCDYFTPQLYWRVAGPQSFSSLLDWWHDQSGSRHVWPGIATERINSSADPGRPAGEIANQVALARRMAPDGGAGACHWSMKALMQNRGGISGMLQGGLYAEKALVPACPWLGRGAPPPPPQAVLQRQGRGAVLTWQSAGGGARWFVVQTLRGGQWRTEAIVNGSQNSQTFAVPPEGAVVRAVSASGICGAPSGGR